MRLLLMFFGLIFSLNSFAVKIKIAVLAPEGTSWANSLKKMSKEIKKTTNGEINIKIYYGGISGDESDVIRKIRVGQMQGGFFTGKTLGEIFGDTRVVEIPFTFYQDRVKAWRTVGKLESYFSQGLEKKNFINLGFYEIGQVYIVSTKKIRNMNELKGIKIWSWEGDQLVKAMVDSIGLVSVPLALPDVLPSLSTGIVDAAYAPPLGIMALQWHTKVKYLVDYPVAFSIGALLIDKRFWVKISTQNQVLIKKIAKKYIKETNLQTVNDNIATLNIFKQNGIEFVKFPESDLNQSKPMRADVIRRLKNKLISPKAISLLKKSM